MGLDQRTDPGCPPEDVPRGRSRMKIRSPGFMKERPAYSVPSVEFEGLLEVGGE